jgi:hypothetical protein
MKRVFDEPSQRIGKHGHRLLEGDAVLASVDHRLVWIPREAHFY